MMKPCEILQTNKQLARCESEERSKHTNTITPTHLIHTNTNTLPKCTRGVTASDQEFLREKVTVKVGCVCVRTRVLNEQEEEGFVNFISFVYFSFNKHKHTHTQTLPSVFSSCSGNIPHFLCVFMFTQYTQSAFIAALRGRHAGGSLSP
uniref:(northern house mosquito) hypothetical protein n=1 Tax=Culex pipiens TaxID=7175 RepID=A0A8D8ATK2_CULPI